MLATSLLTCANRVSGLPWAIGPLNTDGVTSPVRSLQAQRHRARLWPPVEDGCCGIPASPSLVLRLRGDRRPAPGRAGRPHRPAPRRSDELLECSKLATGL